MEKKLQEAIILEVVVYLPEEEKKKKKAHAFVHSLTVLYIHSQFLSAASFKSG